MAGLYFSVVYPRVVISDGRCDEVPAAQFSIPKVTERKMIDESTK